MRRRDPNPLFVLLPTALALALAVAPALVAPAAALPQTGADTATAADDEGEKDVLSAGTFAGLRLRAIGPALTSGRVADLAVHPHDPATYYVAAASGGVWKTENAGTTFRPIFDDQGSYSIGVVTLDPANPQVVWVGTGENNSQRSVGYGDGVYKSLDGGATWKRVGLEKSEHIGAIVVDPTDSDVVWVAAQGPLWSSGGDRGLYKTTDGGATWKKVLEISDDTGVTDVVLDPRDPDTVYAAAYQRRRRVWTLINGGPESALYKSTDGGDSWKELENGLPRVDLGRIGLAIAPSAPDTLYAIVEAAHDEGGFFRSTDRGETWEKRSGYVSSSPQYYQEIFVDPHDADRIYSMDVWMQVSDDGGATFRQAGEDAKHVDNHALWIDPRDPDHLLNGNDGGVYESWDRGATWHFKPNLPLTQFYKISVDTTEPFYYVYGGTQDNFTLGGPSQTAKVNGIANEDWFVAVGGDGFQSRVDPTDPSIVYAQSQYGNLVRHDRTTGETIDIQPQPATGEAPLRWNWDSPLVISPHSPSRLYFAANRLFRSDDRGDSWRAVSPDLTRQLDRNQLEVMGRVWSIDAVSKNRSTSFFGNIVALSESPLAEGLLYVGTDDGLVQVSEDGGESWRRHETFPGVPEMAYVRRLEASRHDADTVYAAFDDHKSGDFRPFVLVSEDRGRNWRSISGDLPERGSVYGVIEDPIDPDLLYAGTEFGAYFSRDRGGRWIELAGGLPTIAVRDLAIHEGEDDLVLGTFGRGFYVLDDLSPLRHADRATLERDAFLFPVSDPWLYVPRLPLGLRGKSFQGASYFLAPNPPFGAVFTYHLRDGLQTRRAARREAERALYEEGGILRYPDWQDLRQESREKDPAVLLTVRDGDGRVVRRIVGPAGPGIHRVAWDLRYPSTTPVRLEPPIENPFFEPPAGPLVVPGTYTVEMATVLDDEATPIGEAESFEVRPLYERGLGPDERYRLLEFQRETAELQRAVMGAMRAADEAQERITYLRRALLDTPGAEGALLTEARQLEERLLDLRVELEGDPVIASHSEPTPPAVADRVLRVVYGLWWSTSPPTETQRQAYRYAAEEFGDLLGRLRTLLDDDLVGLENRLESLGAPWTPGRVPQWSPSESEPPRG